jgi:tetratricopeptide (TPR) repeat protein
LTHAVSLNRVPSPLTIVRSGGGKPSMPSSHDNRHDFFLSRRGSVAAIAQEVTNVLKENGYKVLVQDYDIPITANFIEEMHEAVKNSRDLVVLFTRDYEQSPYTRMEFTSFEANAAQSTEKRRIIILRCEDAPLLGLFAPHVYQDLVGIVGAEERRSRILAAAEGRSQALEPPPRPFIGVAPRIASFTGRTDELDRLDAILMHDKPAAVTQASVGRAAVQGMGGVGKTSLAIEYAHRFRGLYAGVCWCPAETRAGLLSALANLAVTLGAATAEEADVEKAGKAALRRLTEQRATWLLVYDNVTLPDHIADLLPSAGARVLITSRFSDWSELADEVTLDVLPLEEAIALLEGRTGRGDPAGATVLAEALGRLPLALDHAAAYCRRTQMSFAGYAGKASSLMDAAPRGAGYPRSVAATFDLAIAEAVAQCQAAEAFMAYLAQCAPERIPMILVEGAVEGEAERMGALTALSENSLLRHDPFEDGTPAVTIHRLVQAAARTRSDRMGLTRDIVELLMERMLAIYPQQGFNDPQCWPLCAQLTPHMLAPRTYDGSSLALKIGLGKRAGGYFLGRADFSQAEPLLREGLKADELVLGPEHPGTGASLNNLGMLFKARGAFEEARPLLERALRISEMSVGAEHPETAAYVENLATLFRTQGQFSTAQQFSERALAIREKSLGPEHPDTAKSLFNLAILRQDQGELAEARKLFERALAIDDKAFGPEHFNAAANLNGLATALVKGGDCSAARPLLERALAMGEKAFGAEHPTTLAFLSNLAFVYQELGDLRARPLLERALSTSERVSGPEAIETATPLNNLACLLQQQGYLAEARPLFERALLINEKVLGPNHPQTVTALINLGALLQQQGDFDGAYPLIKRARAIRASSLGK